MNRDRADDATVRDRLADRAQTLGGIDVGPSDNRIVLWFEVPV